MNVLLSNDDGINDGGLLELAKALYRRGHNILIVAPDSNRSAYSHALTIGKTIKIKRVDVGFGITAYSTTGTPVDCIKSAMHLFPEFAPDLVLCGVNNGQNLGTDILYSGTLSTAIEASFFDLKGIAISCTSLKDNDHKLLAELSMEIIDLLYPLTNKGEVWNVNIPRLKKEEIKGVKFTPLGKQIYTDTYVKTGEDEYKLVGEIIDHKQNDEDCDVEWNKKGYITVTPILYDKTDYERLNKVRCKNG